jgi:hypothetical protein
MQQAVGLFELQVVEGWILGVSGLIRAAVLMPKNYIDNLSEEARKGMQEKAEQGIWPTKCPLGYRKITGPDGKKEKRRLLNR